jgi:hypothetical protein
MSSVVATAPTGAAPAAQTPPATEGANKPHVPASLAEAKAAVRARRHGQTPPAAKADTPSAAPPAGEMKGATPAISGETPQADGSDKADKPDERVARAFRQIQQKAKEVDNAKKAFEEEKKGHAAKLAAAEEHAASAELLKKDPVEWMKKYGGPDAYNRLTEWRLNGDKQPVDERLTAAEERAAAAEAKARAVEEQIAKEKTAAEEAAKAAAVQSQLAEYRASFAPEFTAQDRATAKLFGVADLETAAVDFAREELAKLRESGIDGGAVDQELTPQKIAVKVKAILEQQLSELRSNEVLQGIFGGATGGNTQDPTPKPTPKPGPKQQQAPSLNNTMSATTDVGLGELSLVERKRIVHQRNRRR